MEGRLARLMETGAVLGALALGASGEASVAAANIGGVEYPEGTPTLLLMGDGGHLQCRVENVYKKDKWYYDDNWSSCLFWTEGSVMPTINAAEAVGYKEHVLKPGDGFYFGSPSGTWHEATCEGNVVIPRRPNNCKRIDKGSDVFVTKVKPRLPRFR